MTDQHRYQKRICHLFFISFGMLGPGMLPPLVKSFEDNYDFSHTEMGSLLTIGAVLATGAAILSGATFDRYGARSILSPAFALCALSALAVWRASTPSAFSIALTLFMVAVGLTASVNPLVSMLYGSDQMRGLTLSHGLQGVGNLLAPLAVALALWATAEWNSVFLLSALMSGVLALAFLWGMKGITGSKKASAASAPRLSRRQEMMRYLNPWLLVGVVGFVFIPAAEGTVKTWMPNYLESEAGFPQTQALLALTFTMVGYTAIRIMLGLRSHGASRSFMLFCMFLFLISFAVVVNVQGTLVLFAASALLGLSFGPYWPSLAAVLFGRLPEARGAVTGLISISGTIGAFLSLAVVGWVADLSSLRFALLLAPASAIIFTMIFRWLTASKSQTVLEQPEPAVR